MPDDDPFLENELAALEAEVAVCAEVHREQWGDGIVAVNFQPRNPAALPMTWIRLGRDELIFEAGAGAGGRWELALTSKDLRLLRDLVESIVAGRVEEAFGPSRRSSVCVTFADGRTSTSTGMSGLWPALGWKRRGRKVHYSQYVAS